MGIHLTQTDSCLKTAPVFVAKQHLPVKCRVSTRASQTHNTATHLSFSSSVGSSASLLRAQRLRLSASRSTCLPVRADDDDDMPSPMTIAPFHSALTQLLDHRIIRLGGVVEDDMANAIVAQLLYLDAKDSNKDVTIYLNSPGGSVTAGMAIFDTMRHIRPDVSTTCVGMAASMGAFLLSAGTKGKRFALPNARIMIHQPLGGAQGQAADIELQTKEMMYHKENLNKYLAEFTGKTFAEMKADTDRDFFLGAEESVEYGIIDAVISNPTWDQAKQVDTGMYDFEEYDWRELPTLDPLHPANQNLDAEF
ncbi:ATP-dependent Clp protease proteolytic subunit 5 [Cymbomonas tetramitiformis]|uniref:ATP-dependent Clp protease proteolytic subunit n=1 Tax=Cymbomonas tetramitiformis TaxID=36881 RepID=A0AAE0FDZ1_9CHLO|nr:ATP-dependent Clp protease proteolytic subunit 5 [Cymbomonas tetramitiformis]KAK3282606.1 ATP-dependent Clp protease proteolytic subunit 5 [Cymbomonas tetramitiformis]